MRFTCLFILVFLSFTCNVFACAERKPEPNPVLVSFGPIMFNPLIDNSTIFGVVKANISIDDNGEVVAAEIIQLTPNDLDKAPIIEAILKSRFNVRQAYKDYMFSFEFGG